MQLLSIFNMHRKMAGVFLREEKLLNECLGHWLLEWKAEHTEILEREKRVRH